MATSNEYSKQQIRFGFSKQLASHTMKKSNFCNLPKQLNFKNIEHTKALMRLNCGNVAETNLRFH